MVTLGEVMMKLSGDGVGGGGASSRVVVKFFGSETARGPGYILKFSNSSHPKKKSGQILQVTNYVGARLRPQILVPTKRLATT